MSTTHDTYSPLHSHSHFLYSSISITYFQFTDRPISVAADESKPSSANRTHPEGSYTGTHNLETKDTFSDVPRPEGSYTGAHALADDSIRQSVGKKDQYPLRVAKYAQAGDDF